MWKKKFRISNLKYVVSFLIPAIFVMFLNHGLDNDSWFVLAEGRYLVQNGVHYTDVLTMHEGMDIVVQNYGFAAIFYLFFSTFGASGIYLTMLVINFIICYLIYKICMLISNKNTNLSLLIMMITDLVLVLGFMTTRAQIVSYVIFLLLIYVLELFIKTDKTRYLWWIPFLSLIQINLHASLWWMLIIVLGVYIIDSFKKPKKYLEGYRTKPLLLITGLAFLVGFINPYGVKMITYIFTSYGASEIVRIVDEMKPFDLRRIINCFLYISLVIVLLLMIYGNKKRIRFRYLLMFFGFLALGLNTVKGMSQFILVEFFPLALLYKDIRIEKYLEAEKAKKAVVVWSGIVVSLIFIVQCVVVVPMINDSPGEGIVHAMDSIEESSIDREKEKVYVGYNNGGYVEYRGFKAYIDPRAEIFLKKNNGKDDIMREWGDVVANQINFGEFLEKYDFDYLIVDKNDGELYEMENKNYRIIFEDEEEKIKVYKKLGD